jgi:hypothetical protein
MPYTTSHPIHELGIILIRKHTTILLSLLLRLCGRNPLIQLPLLLLLPPPLFFLSPLPLCAIIKQESQRAT